MNADTNAAEIGVQLRAAILRARVARGEKPSFGISWEGRF